MTPEPLTPEWTCQWCGSPLTPDDGVWTDDANSGDYCPEGLAVGSTGTSPHLPVATLDAARNVTAQPDLAAARVQCEYGHWAWPGRCEHGHVLRSQVPAEGLDVERLAPALAVVFAYNASNASVAPDGSLAFGEGPTSYWRDRAEAVLAALASDPQPDPEP